MIDRFDHVLTNLGFTAGARNQRLTPSDFTYSCFFQYVTNDTLEIFSFVFSRNLIFKGETVSFFTFLNKRHTLARNNNFQQTQCHNLKISINSDKGSYFSFKTLLNGYESAPFNCKII